MILQLLIAWLVSRIQRHQDHVIRYLREENRRLKAKPKGKQMQLTDAERRRLAILAHPIERKALNNLSTIATPDTLQRWYRRFLVHGASRSTQGKVLDVHFISSLPVMQRLACKAWTDKRPVQIVWAVSSTRPDHDVVDDACG